MAPSSTSTSTAYCPFAFAEKPQLVVALKRLATSSATRRRRSRAGSSRAALTRVDGNHLPVAVIDVAGFVADLRSQAIDHGFHVHDERHFVETYSLRQLWEVDLHSEEACSGHSTCTSTWSTTSIRGRCSGSRTR